MSDEEIEFFIKTTVGDDGVIDIGEFANLLLKLKMREQRQAKKKK